MPRMFDVLKRDREQGGHKPDQKKEDRDFSEKKPLYFPKEIIKSHFLIKMEKTEDRSSLSSEKLISTMKKHGTDSQEKADEVYMDAIGIINNILAKIRANEDMEPYMPKIYELLSNIFNQLILGDSMLNDVYEKKGEGHYLPYHIVNVLILSSAIGLNMGFNKSRLNHIGLASIFYDAGLDMFRKVIELPRKLTVTEYSLIKTHVDKSLDAVVKVSSISEVVKYTIKMHHERADGSGYPVGLKSNGINPYAKIIGLADMYEAITHDRPHREGINTHKAIKLLIGPSRDKFDVEAMKIFINKMSIYPIGSIVELNTGEIARVTNTQPGSPLRPIVMIIRNSYGEHIVERKIVNLAKENLIFIKKAL